MFFDRCYKIIEDEKRFSANNYHLPNTYDADWKEKKEIAIERKRAGHNIATNVVLCGDKRKDFEMICGSTIVIARFLAGIQTEASKFVDSIDNLNDMEDAAFSELFNLLCVGFDAQMMQSARKVAESRIRQHLPDDILTIREEIILDLYSMRKTVNEN